MTNPADLSTTQPATTQPDAPKIVVITGASSGIGEATARRLAAEGHLVVLGARRQDRLVKIVAGIQASGGRAEHGLLDVTDRAAVQSFVDGVVERHGRVDVLVNNAGVMPLSRLDALLVDEWDQMIDVNVRGLLHGIAAGLPHFQAQRSGHFVTVASIGAHEVPVTSAVYSGSKFAAWAITDGLRQELDPSIRVTTISPGVTTSELAGSISDPGAKEMMTAYRAFAIPADAIARGISYAMQQPADVDVNELIIRPAGQR